jgi:hypothetical protein
MFNPSLNLYLYVCISKHDEKEHIFHFLFIQKIFKKNMGQEQRQKLFSSTYEYINITIWKETLFGLLITVTDGFISQNI